MGSNPTPGATTFLSWQYIFFINIPIGIIAVILGLRHLKDTAKTSAGMDVVGMMLLGGSLTLLSFGATSFSAEGPTVLNLGVVLLGYALIPIFVFYENRQRSPMIDFTSFRDRILRNASLSTFFVSLGYLAVAFLVIMYLQGVRGLSPLNASISIPRDLAFQIFIGTTNLSGGLSDAFIAGIDGALYVSLIMLVIAGALSWIRGREIKTSSS